MRIIRLAGYHIRELHYTPCGTALVAAWGDSLHTKGVRRIDLSNQRDAGEVPVPFGEMAITPDLTALVRLQIDRQQLSTPAHLEIHDFAQGALLQRLPLRLHLTSLLFSPDSQLLLVAGVNYVDGVPVYEVDRWVWRNRHDLPPLTVPGLVVSLAMTKERRLLVTGGADNTARIWRNDTGTLLDEWKHKATVRRLLFAERDRVLVAAAGCSVALWDTGARRQLVRFPPHRKQVNDLALSPDGLRLATASNDGTVRLWELASGIELRSFAWGIGRVGAIAFAPDGLTIAAGGEAGQIVIWDVDA